MEVGNVLFFDKRPASDQPWTERLWVYDFRTNMHFTRKQSALRRDQLQDFVDCYLAGKPRSERVETERFKAFTYEELLARATKPTSTSPGSATTPWKTSTTYRHPKSSPAKSSRTSPLHSPSSKPWRQRWRQQHSLTQQATDC